jgi:FtsH-binding integral membrane protein
MNYIGKLQQRKKHHSSSHSKHLGLEKEVPRKDKWIKLSSRYKVINMTDEGNKPPAISWRGPTWNKGVFPDTGGMKFIRSVYNWTFLGLIISAAVACLTYAMPTIASFVTFQAKGIILISSLIVELLFMIWTRRHINKFSKIEAFIIFFIYSALTGFTLSVASSALRSDSVIIMFLVTAAVFGIMSIFAYYVKTDLSTAGHFVGMALFGLVIATIANLFLKSGPQVFTVAYAGIIVFVVLTFLSTTQQKRMFDLARTPINGALMITLNIIKIFVALLMINAQPRGQMAALQEDPL